MKEFYRRHLPHWQRQDAVFFVTFRLKGSLPYEIIQSLREERERAKVASHTVSVADRASQNALGDQQYFDQWEEYLDKAEFGPRWLSQPEVAVIVKEAMHYRDEKVFDLHTYCIMPNHVHVIFEPLSGSGWQPDGGKSECHSNLRKIMQSLKRHTARQANLVLGKEGPFWQDESYDRVIRDNEAYVRTIYYVLENPVKAGLVACRKDWPWTYCKPGILQ
jgi:REP element-mobilizing transposase RayT